MNEPASIPVKCLRQDASGKPLPANPHDANPALDGDLSTLRLLHELQVHQVELELQNEELIRTRNELESALNRYTELYDYAPVAYFSVTPLGVIVRLNHQGASLLGMDRGKLVGLSIRSFLVVGSRMVFDAFFADLLSSQQKQNCEVDLQLGPDNIHHVWVEARWQADLQSCQLVFTDITARRRLEQERERLRDRLLHSQKMETIGRLAGGVAHDFNNILCSTLLNLNLLEGTESLDRSTLETVGELKHEAERASKLTRQLLAFSRQTHMQLTEISLDGIVKNMLKMLHRLIGDQHRIQYLDTDNTWSVKADASMMEQVLLNLVINARDAMAAGGVVRVSLYNRTWVQTDVEHCPNRRCGRFVVLEVSDTGCGIPPELMQSIFEPFFTTKALGQGTGLGLATVDGIAAQHAGWIEAESVVGQGSCFKVFIPAVERAVATDEGKAPGLPCVSGSEQILLVEDEPMVRATIRRSLVKAGYRVLESVCAVEGLALFKEKGESIDLVLTDMSMPGGMNGLELASIIHLSSPKLPVIIMSGYSRQLAPAAFAANTSLKFLDKPFDLERLSALLRQSLERH